MPAPSQLQSSLFKPPFRTAFGRLTGTKKEEIERWFLDALRRNQFIKRYNSQPHIAYQTEGRIILAEGPFHFIQAYIIDEWIGIEAGSPQNLPPSWPPSLLPSWTPTKNIIFVPITIELWASNETLYTIHSQPKKIIVIEASKLIEVTAKADFLVIRHQSNVLLTGEVSKPATT